MTPERLARFIPRLLQALRPPPVDFHPVDAAAFCRWLSKLSHSGRGTAPDSPLGPLWPRLPRIAANHYSLALAPRHSRLACFDAGPIQTTNEPGVNSHRQRLPALPFCQRVSGHVIACNGEVAFARTDAIIPGPLEFCWQRFYRHGNTEDVGLGIGWRHSLSEQLVVRDGAAELHTAEGRLVRFGVPAIGHSCYNRFERLLLHRQSLHSYRITGFDQPHRIFRADGVNSALPLVEIRDQFGNALTVDYSGGLPRKMVSSWGRVVEFHCGEQHIEKLTNAQAPGDQQALCQYHYDTQWLAEAAVGLEREHYEYRDQLLTSIDSADTGRLRFHYDSQQRCHKLECNQLVQTLSWRRAQRRCTLHAAGRHPIHWKFNDCGQLVGAQQQDRCEHWLYDLYGNLGQATVAGGRRTVYRHDELGRLTRRTRNGISDRHLYDQRGFLAAVQQNADQVWRYEYSDQGLPVKITDPEGQRWQCQYSDRGQLLQLTDPEGGSIQLNWDSQGQLRTIQRGGHRWEFQYNHWQQLTALTLDGETRQQWHYGQAGELRETGIGEHRYQLDYDTRGRPCALREQNGQSLQWHGDAAGNCREILFADGREWRMQYDVQGQLAGLETETGSTQWQYDQFGQLANCRDSHDRLRQWLYNADGEVCEYRDNDARWYLHYSDDGNLQQIHNNSGQRCAFHYDRQQRLIQADNTHSSVRFQYDRRNLLTAEHHDGRDAGGIALRHQYDARGWLKSTSSESLDLAYTLAPGGDLYGIDANGEPIIRCETRSQITDAIQGGLHSHYSYRCGQVASIETDRELAWQFTAEAPIHLGAPETDTAMPDAAALPRDARGNIAREPRAGGRENLYQYDGWGLLSSAECGDFKTYFRYDPFGRRLGKLSTHRKSTRQRRVNTSWYGLGIWCETHSLDGQAQPQVHYLYHPSAQTLLCRWQAGKIEHYIVDPAGEPLALFDHQGGLLWPAETPPGEETERKVHPGPWRGNGLLADSETGLYYCWRGYWNPFLHSWLNRVEWQINS